MNRIFFLCSLLTLTGCQYGNVVNNVQHIIHSQIISINNAKLKNCTFSPLARIVHFPMYHYPEDGQYDQTIFDQVSKSQFQLLQTIVAYKSNIVVFDEHITSDSFDTNFITHLQQGYEQGTYTRLDGTSYQYLERYRKAYALFGNGIPQYYEYLSQEQKNYLFGMGASLTLLFLSLIPKIHKVISTIDFNHAKVELTDPSTGRYKNFNTPTSLYWIFDFRELKLKEQVLNFYRTNQSEKLILIAYGANHNFSEEFQGYPFESGEFCLSWLPKTFQINPS